MLSETTSKSCPRSNSGSRPNSDGNFCQLLPNLIPFTAPKLKANSKSGEHAQCAIVISLFHSRKSANENRASFFQIREVNCEAIKLII